MDTRSQNHGSTGSRRTGRHSQPRHAPVEEQAPSANHFITVHESHIPWEGDDPVYHEDERYETLAGAEAEREPKIYEHFRIMHGAEDCEAAVPGEPGRLPTTGKSL